jgi:hypothetical protein
VISIAEDDLRAQFFQSFLRNSLNGSDRADRHKDRGFDLAVRGVESAETGFADGFFDAEGNGHSSWIVTTINRLDFLLWGEFMLKELDVVRLKRTVPGIPVPEGTRGTLVWVAHSDPPGGLVEFMDENGKTFGVYPVEESDLELAS